MACRGQTRVQANNLVAASKSAYNRPQRSLISPTLRTTAARKLRAQASSAEGVAGETSFSLPDGFRLEVLHTPARAGGEAGGKPPLVFVHGSGHGAWCWQEKWAPWFAERGYDCHAISLRGQAGSDRVEGQKPAGSLSSHAHDVGEVIAARCGGAAPVLVAHSFGGLVLQEFFATRPLWALKLTWALIRRSYATDEATAREMYFSDALPDADLARYVQLFKKYDDNNVLLDVGQLEQQLPAKKGPAPADCPPVMVVGTTQDNVVDVEGVQETGDYYGVEPVLFDGIGHDVMLDAKWETVASAVDGWIVSSVQQSNP